VLSFDINRSTKIPCLSPLCQFLLLS
jgi:hypothetical protein